MRTFLVSFLCLVGAVLHRSEIAPERTALDGAVNDAAVDEYFASLARRYDHLRFSVVRIMSVSVGFSWMAPFAMMGGGGGSVGTGWILQDGSEPIIVTNAHVVNAAPSVAIQVLPLGKFKWQVRTVAICHKFDLAVLKLVDPHSLLAELSTNNFTLSALPLAEHMPTMGDEVVALGFPLGQETMKISQGVISGHENVNGNLCLQSTAAISPGNSGGPLLTRDGKTVVGVNFAKSAAQMADSINFVIPIWRVRHVIETYKVQEAKGDPRVQVRYAPSGAVTVPGHPSVYALAGCKKGVLISKLQEHGAFVHADPPISERAMLTKVNGVELDRYGMGRDAHFAEDKVDFEQMLFFQEDITKPMMVETCSKGVDSKHAVQITFNRSMHENAVPQVDEPMFASLPYELFGDIGVMPLTQNAAAMFAQNFHQQGGYRWAAEDKPKLVVNYVSGPSAQYLRPGAIVKRVNGIEVNTLEDYRKAMIPAELRMELAKLDAKAETEKATVRKLLKERTEKIRAAMEAEIAARQAQLKAAIAERQKLEQEKRKAEAARQNTTRPEAVGNSTAAANTTAGAPAALKKEDEEAQMRSAAEHLREARQAAVAAKKAAQEHAAAKEAAEEAAATAKAAAAKAAAKVAEAKQRAAEATKAAAQRRAAAEAAKKQAEEAAKKQETEAAQKEAAEAAESEGKDVQSEDAADKGDDVGVAKTEEQSDDDSDSEKTAADDTSSNGASAESNEEPAPQAASAAVAAAADADEDQPDQELDAGFIQLDQRPSDEFGWQSLLQFDADAGVDDEDVDVSDDDDEAIAPTQPQKVQAKPQAKQLAFASMVEKPQQRVSEPPANKTTPLTLQERLSQVVWTLETDQGDFYAALFFPTLVSQLRQGMHQRQFVTSGVTVAAQAAARMGQFGISVLPGSLLAVAEEPMRVSAPQETAADDFQALFDTVQFKGAGPVFVDV
mmetsp:Transcript_33877/g.88158  ORF Transcript_33877/g.88158 Transcript_33877/m.88158 type:complete len:953 (-) Transcript_33877:119-2977(-)